MIATPVKTALDPTEIGNCTDGALKRAIPHPRLMPTQRLSVYQSTRSARC